MSSTPTTEELIAKFREKTAALKAITQKSLKIITDYKAKSASGSSSAPARAPLVNNRGIEQLSEEAKAAAAEQNASASAAAVAAEAEKAATTKVEAKSTEETLAIKRAAEAESQKTENAAREAAVAALVAKKILAEAVATEAAEAARQAQEVAEAEAIKARQNQNAANSRAAEKARLEAIAAGEEAARAAATARALQSPAPVSALPAVSLSKQKLELIGGAVVKEVNEDFVEQLTDLPKSIKDILAKAKPILSIKPHIIEKKDYDNVYLTSDIHADLRKFIRLLVNAGLIQYNGYDVKTLQDGPIPSQAVWDFEWIAPKKTLLIIIGDLVDGKRPNGPYSVNDTKGNIELLLHIFLYNLRIKALDDSSEVRFTLGNHDYGSILTSELWSSYIHEEVDDFFTLQGRRKCLIPFYDCCPYIFLTLDNEIMCVHGGMAGLDDTVIRYQNMLQEKLKEDKTIEQILNEDAIMDILSKDAPTPLWSRSYSNENSTTTCPIIENTSYKMVVVGHCVTGTDFTHFNEIRTKYKESAKQGDHNDGGRCDRGGCVLIGCENLDTGPRLAFVDIGMSEAMSLGKEKTKKKINEQRAEFLHLQHDPHHPDTVRYYNIISRIKLDDGVTLDAAGKPLVDSEGNEIKGKESILMWRDPSIREDDAESVASGHSFGTPQSLSPRGSPVPSPPDSPVPSPPDSPVPSPLVPAASSSFVPPSLSLPPPAPPASAAAPVPAIKAEIEEKITKKMGSLQSELSEKARKADEIKIKDLNLAFNLIDKDSTQKTFIPGAIKDYDKMLINYDIKESSDDYKKIDAWVIARLNEKYPNPFDSKEHIDIGLIPSGHTSQNSKLQDAFKTLHRANSYAGDQGRGYYNDCLLHAFLTAVSPSFRKCNRDIKNDTAHYFRRKIFNEIANRSIRALYDSTGHLDPYKLMGNEIKTFKSLLLTSDPLTDLHMKFLASYFKINICFGEAPRGGASYYTNIFQSPMVIDMLSQYNREKLIDKNEEKANQTKGILNNLIKREGVIVIYNSNPADGHYEACYEKKATKDKDVFIFNYDVFNSTYRKVDLYNEASQVSVGRLKFTNDDVIKNIEDNLFVVVSSTIAVNRISYDSIYITAFDINPSRIAAIKNILDYTMKYEEAKLPVDQSLAAAVQTALQGAKAATLAEEEKSKQYISLKDLLDSGILIDIKTTLNNYAHISPNEDEQKYSKYLESITGPSLTHGGKYRKNKKNKNTRKHNAKKRPSKKSSRRR